MLLKISHQTAYHYDAPIPYALQQLRMIPKDSAGQKVINWTTRVEGAERQLDYMDQHNNHVELYSFPPDQQDIIIHCHGEVDTSDTAGSVGKHGGFAPLWYFLRETPLTKAGPGIRKLVRQFDDPGVENGDAPRLFALLNHIRDTVRYEVGTSHSETTAEEALTAETGVCQDHAHLFIAMARLLDYPARYVSGYLLIDGQTEQDAGHGWAEVHVPVIGWIGFDVSNGISPDERYVRVATGLDFKEASPVSGIVYGGAQADMTVTLSVEEKPQSQQQQQSSTTS